MLNTKHPLIPIIPAIAFFIARYTLAIYKQLTPTNGHLKGVGCFTEVETIEQPSLGLKLLATI